MTIQTVTNSNQYFPNVLLVSGSGRNCGKTMLICNIIKQWRAHEHIVTIKISAHTHDHAYPLHLIHKEPGFAVWEEQTITHKDSGRFLSAGAARVLYIESSDDKLLKSYHIAHQLVDKNSLIICESGGLGKFIRPGAMLFVQHKDEVLASDKEYLRQLCNRIILSGSPEMEDPSLILFIKDHSWHLRQNDRV